MYCNSNSPIPCIITCAITGRTTHEMNANVPITPKEQGIAAAEAFEAGARVIHLHSREDDGRQTHRPERIAESIYEIRTRVPEAIIEISTRASSLIDGIDRGGCLELSPAMWKYEKSLKPEMCSLNMGTLNLRDEVFLNLPQDIEEQAKRIYQIGLLPELDIFDVGQMENAFRLLHRGILKLPFHLLFVLGSGGISANPANLVHLINLLPPGTHWTGLGAGRDNFSVAMMSIAFGGHVRTGLEDTTYIGKGQKAQSNAQLVKKLASFCSDFGRQIATPAQTRDILNLSISQSYSVRQSVLV
jgi:3-keto-5-aminohexanoate cleavage enzyme